MLFTQKERALRVSTPLGPDKFLIVGLSGTEAVSRLYQFRLDLLAENSTAVAFDQLIGQPITVELDLPGGKKRYFSGLCSSLAEGRRDSVFTRYRMEIVPKFWLLTRRTQCRIFQHQSVPEILKEALAGLDVKWDLQGKYDERDYCVQYRETDFAFASRLMEEEGIYFYFKHSGKGHEMVVADTPQGHADVPEAPRVLFEEVQGGNREDMRVSEWEKVQELRSGKVTLWDHCFELPGKQLEAVKTVVDAVTVGKVSHKLKVAGNDKLELYDYPGAYAQRYDGVDSGGGSRPGDLEKIFQDNQRTAKIRMEQEAAQGLEVRGTSNCRQFTAGHKFTLEKHFNGDGAYVLLSVGHNARLTADYRSGEGETLEYANQFTCLPAALPYRPPLQTPEPTIQGPQTATVVGPAGEKIFCDKYGRVKVQFHWDRAGKKNADSSCWVRVSQNWGGAKWGGMFIPHVGQEVIVEFEEGDPDRPLITGRVYNAEAMPPLELPANNTLSIIRDHGANEIKMQGDDGKQSIRMYSPHGETIFKLGAPNDDWAGIFMKTAKEMKADVTGLVHFIFDNNWQTQVTGDQVTAIKANQKTSVDGHQFMEVLGSAFWHFVGSWDHKINGSLKLTLMGMKNELVVGSDTKVVLGARNDITGGIRMNIMKGNRYEANPNGALKSEKDLKKVGTILQSLGKVYQKIGGNKLVKLVEDKVQATVHKRHQGKIEDNVEEVDIDASSKYHLSSPSITLEGDVTITGDLHVKGQLQVDGMIVFSDMCKLD